MCSNALLKNLGKIETKLNHFNEEVYRGFEFHVLTNSLSKLAITIKSFSFIHFRFYLYDEK